MSIDTRLLSFVRKSLQQQLPREEIEQVLVEAGWSRHSVRDALSMFAAIPYPVPVPKPRATLAAREAFVYILIFSTLCTCAAALTHLAFNSIDFVLNELQGAFMAENRGALSSLIIVLPIFIGLSRWQARQEARNPGLRAAEVRKILTYVTLFLTASILIGDLICLVYIALGHELTPGFVLKSLSLFVLYSTIFWYYLDAMRQADSLQI